MTTKPDNSGLLVIDKPQGVTSHDVVAAVRGALQMKRVGHAGTLDPMATGVLVVGFGNATRLLNYIVDHDKTYLATIRLGQRTTHGRRRRRTAAGGGNYRRISFTTDR